MRTPRILAAALAIAVLAVPVAQAQPPDMHASVALAAAKARQHQDLRSPDARDAAANASRHQDLRSPDARDAAVNPRGPGHPINAPGATAVDSASELPLPGPPTWPVNPRPITAAPQAQPVNDDGVEWTTIGLGIAGSLIAVSGLALVANRRRTPRLRASV